MLFIRIYLKNLFLLGFARFLTMLPRSIAQFVTLGHDEPIPQWYDKNGIYKFPVGSRIALANRCSFGYGIRPIGVVKGYTSEGKYIIEMEVDTDGDFFNWMNNRNYISRSTRVKSDEIHFKWNIEYHFKRIPNADVELAYRKFQ